MIAKFVIEIESVASFKSSLRSRVPDECLDLGDVIFLETKTFDASYLSFLDDCAANFSYAPERREQARRRRRALEHHLGTPLLHGLIARNQIDYVAFVDKASLEVLQLEEDLRIVS